MNLNIFKRIFTIRDLALEFAISIPDSSMAEQPAVNRQVLGSSPSQGAFYVNLNFKL